MKKWSWLACCSILVMTALMAPAARAQGPYVSVSVGSTWLEDADNAFKAFPLEFTTEYDLGFNVGAASGYDYGPWRAEIELAYRQNDLDTLAALGSSFNAAGDLSALSLMFNGFVDLPTPGPLTPYLGGGLGMAWVSANDVTVEGDPVVDDDDAVFAYQLAAGVGWEIMSKVTLDLGYRFFATTDPEFSDVDGETFESEYQSHNLLAGLRIGF